MKKHLFLFLVLDVILVTSCAPLDLNAPVPVYDTSVDPATWATIPAGSFFLGQAADPTYVDYTFEIMVTDVTVAQFVDFLNAALADGSISIEGNTVTGPYPGDTFLGKKHEIRIAAGQYILVPTDDPASKFTLTDGIFSVQPGWENHPMTNVSWFGAWTYCGYFEGRLPIETEWEKAARGSLDDRPFPWGYEILRNNANYYSSRDPFEDMSSFGSRTSPVGFYNGNTYGEYATLDSSSPFGLYDMAGNVWQWVGDILPGFSDRFMHGGSKDTYDMDLRIWVRNSAAPMYYSPDVGFRCVRLP
jgi:formylglycine-generating enzyme